MTPFILFSPADFGVLLGVLVQAMHSVATSRSRTRTRLRSAPQTWTMMAAIPPAPWGTAQWKAAAASTTTPAGGSTSAGSQTSMALLKTWTTMEVRGRTSSGTPGDTMESLAPSNQ